MIGGYCKVVYSNPRSKYPFPWPVFFIWIGNAYKQEREGRGKREEEEEGEEEKRREEGRQPRQSKALSLLVAVLANGSTVEGGFPSQPSLHASLCTVTVQPLPSGGGVCFSSF